MSRSLKKVLNPFKSIRSTPARLSNNDSVQYPGTPMARETWDLQVMSDAGSTPIPVYTTQDPLNNFKPKDDPKLSDEMLLKIIRDMTMVRSMDKKFEQTQRIGLNSFYMTCRGEEGITCVMPLAMDPADVIYTQYREQGVFLSRGVPIEELAKQVFARAGSHADGKQMPVHYGSKKYNLPTVSSPLGTQIIQAVGHAYAIKRSSDPDRCVATFFGDGSASEGDAFAALNFASVLEAPVVFCCRNNGYAISTPVKDQYKGDGIAARGVALGMDVIRLNGNDVFAVYNAVKKAREIAVNESRPVLIEFMTYRAGNHSTSDDSSAYRPKAEIDMYMDKYDPISKYEMYLRKERPDLWDSQKSLDWQEYLNKSITQIVDEQKMGLKPCPSTLFTDVYDPAQPLPPNLEEQRKQMLEHLENYGEKYNLSQYEKKY